MQNADRNWVAALVCLSAGGVRDSTVDGEVGDGEGRWRLAAGAGAGRSLEGYARWKEKEKQSKDKFPKEPDGKFEAAAQFSAGICSRIQR